jgi:hypothetical protein
MLVKLCLLGEKLDYKFKLQSKDYANQIKKLDDYMGYMAWAEIYLSNPQKKDLGV